MSIINVSIVISRNLISWNYYNRVLLGFVLFSPISSFFFPLLVPRGLRGFHNNDSHYNCSFIHIYHLLLSLLSLHHPGFGFSLTLITITHQSHSHTHTLLSLCPIGFGFCVLGYHSHSHTLIVFRSLSYSSLDVSLGFGSWSSSCLLFSHIFTHVIFHILCHILISYHVLLNHHDARESTSHDDSSIILVLFWSTFVFPFCLCFSIVWVFVYYVFVTLFLCLTCWSTHTLFQHSYSHRWSLHSHQCERGGMCWNPLLTVVGSPTAAPSPCDTSHP